MNMIPLFVVIPLGAGFILAVLFKAKEYIGDIISNLVGITLAVMSVFLFIHVAQNGPIVYEIGKWGIFNSIPIGIFWVVDSLSALMILLVNMLFFFILVYSIDYMSKFTQKIRYYALMFLALAGMNGVMLTGDIFNMFVFLEIASIATYALVAFVVNHEDLEAAFKYLVMGSVGGVFILFGIGIIYGLTGTLNFADIAASEVIRQGIKTGSQNNLILLAKVLFFIGVGIKAAIVPLHGWCPDAYETAPTPVSALLAALSKKALGIYLIVRLFYNVLGVNDKTILVFLIFGVLSAGIGSVVALKQNDMKRMFAYSSISQMGFILLGLGSNHIIGIMGAIFHIINHSVIKMMLFLDSGNIYHSTGERGFDKVGGVSKLLPVTGNTTVIGSLSMAGFPPLNGFFSKLLIILGLIHAGRISYAVMAIILSVVTLAYYLRMLRKTIWGPLKQGFKLKVKTPGLMNLVVIVLSGVCIAIGVLYLVYPPFMDTFIKPAAEVLLQGLNYSKVVLGG